MRYRVEIDGLRSLAILPVLAFHAGMAPFSGGFTGVDVFFVISGFLITGIILGEIDTGDFSILEFYKRRILRLLPALTVVLVATVVAAWALMLPNEFVSVGRSVVATTLFASNIHFWRHSGYFDAAADLKPLLHTWSLAVEEQFYLFFPLLLMAVARWLAGRVRLVIGALVLASFAAAVILTPSDPDTAFYLLPTRVWELGIGAMIAAGGFPAIAAGALGGRGRDLAAWTGIGLIGYGMFGLTDADPFPGWNALFPCLGAALVIAYGAGTSAGRLLSHAVPVHIGRISYSLYLWHWPVIVFWRLAEGQRLSLAGTIGVLALSFLLAELTCRYVETPFRAGRFRALPAVRVLRPGAAILAGLLLLGAAVGTTGGSWRSYPEEVLRVAGYTDYRLTADYVYQYGKNDGCTASGYRRDEVYQPEKCLSFDPARRNYLIIGDSHAGALWRAIELAFPEANYSRAMISGCRPLLDAEGDDFCRETNNSVFRTFVANHRLDGVILIGRWRETDFDELGRTVDFLRPHAGRIIVFGPTVEYHGEFPLLLASERMTGSQGITEHAIDSGRKALSDAMGLLVEEIGAEFIPTWDAICGGPGGCVELAPDGMPMQFDYGHLTLGGAKLVISRVRDRLALDG